MVFLILTLKQREPIENKFLKSEVIRYIIRTVSRSFLFHSSALGLLVRGHFA